MPSAKSGSAGTADAPAEPDPAKDAADADPGDVSSADANPGQTQSKQWKDVKLDSGGDSDQDEDRNHWISIELKDDKGKPVPNEPFEVKVGDGTITGGSLDDKGKARVEGLPAGQCEVRFPRLHNSEWRKA